jgi:naphthalene 1,2-dioxygenase system ferredoxin subunit|tara:strand:- start:1595 stop:1918 length:324 start_codon:yes stop_codon:yes gene_type:complete
MVILMTTAFIPVFNIDDIPEGEMRRCDFEGQDIALFNVEGCIYATQNECTHGRAALTDGYLFGDEIECPLHQGMFNVRTGEAVAAPCTEPIRTYVVEVHNGVIYLEK